jgi:hypothetical protein
MLALLFHQVGRFKYSSLRHGIKWNQTNPRKPVTKSAHGERLYYLPLWKRGIKGDFKSLISSDYYWFSFVPWNTRLSHREICVSNPPPDLFSYSNLTKIQYLVTVKIRRSK